MINALGKYDWYKLNAHQIKSFDHIDQITFYTVRMQQNYMENLHVTNLKPTFWAYIFGS